MNFDKLLNKTKNTLKIIPDSINQVKYDKNYWDKFILSCINDKQIELNTDDGIHKFICSENSLYSNGSLIKEYSVIFSHDNNSKITFTDTSGKTFEFRTPLYIFRYDNGSFIFQTNEEMLSSALIITNSVKSIEELTSYNVNKIKYVLSDTSVITDNLFFEFISNPQKFDTTVEALWKKLEKPFEIDFRNINKKDFSDIESFFINDEAAETDSIITEE